MTSTYFTAIFNSLHEMHLISITFCGVAITLFLLIHLYTYLYYLSIQELRQVFFCLPSKPLSYFNSNFILYLLSQRTKDRPSSASFPLKNPCQQIAIKSYFITMLQILPLAITYCTTASVQEQNPSLREHDQVSFPFNNSKWIHKKGKILLLPSFHISFQYAAILSYYSKYVGGCHLNIYVWA